MGTVDNTGTYSGKLNMNAIYDYSISPTGKFYFVADAQALGDSSIYTFDWTTNTAAQIASVGGYQGGIAFDSQGSLYYAHQGSYDQNWNFTSVGIIKYTAEQLEGSTLLTVSDSLAVSRLTVGYIGFDNNDDLYATTGWGTLFAKYDLVTDTKIEDIAYGDIGKFVIDGEDIYALNSPYTGISSIQKIFVPEPTTIAVLALGSLLLRKRK
jgi:hypothetical protein